MTRRLGRLLLPLALIACATPAPTPSPSPTPPIEGFYLRAWVSQALPPDGTFTWLPMLTIHDGLVIDGNIAVPAIYPGPLVIVPNLRAISAAGQAAIVAHARELGLLEGDTDFSGGGLMPGAQTAHITLTIDGTTHDLLGDPSALVRCPPGDLRCIPEVGSPAAFAVLWQRLGFLEEWLATELGPQGRYTPLRIAVLTSQPTAGDLVPNVAQWPLETALAQFGEPWALEGTRCATVSGDDLATLLPILLVANQATVFVDTEDQARSLLVRVLVPGEPSPCADLG